MTKFSYFVVYNPISIWFVDEEYTVGDKVLSNVTYYRAILNHTSAAGNNPPNGTYWEVITPTNPNVDITNFVETLKDIDIGSGETRSLSLRLNADRGQFITDENDGATPIIDEFDKIRISILDRDNKIYSAVHEVVNIKPVHDSVQGAALPIELMGSEFYLMRTLFAEQFFFKSMFEASKGICDLYNENRGELQPKIIQHDKSSADDGFNDLAKFTATDYLFNLSELPHYDGLINIMDRGGASIAAGGAGDFFEIAFESGDRPEIIKYRGFSSGNPSDQTTIPNIIDTDSVNPGEEEGGIEATKGTIVGTWCGDGIGSLPRQNANFVGALEAWPLFPSHIVGEKYPKDAIIIVPNTLDNQFDSFHYKANKDTVLAPPIPTASSNADWNQYFFTNFLTNEISYPQLNYSFWTNAKANQWKTNGANTGGTEQADPATFESLSVWDSNQVVVDGVYGKTWVDARAVNEANIPATFKRNGQVYRGFRVLVNGIGSAEFLGFDNMVIQWNGEEWLIFKRPAEDNLVAVDNEAHTYQFKNSIWTDITTSLGQSNDCYHPVYNITNTQGHNDRNNGAGGNFGQNSAVTYEFRYSKADSGPVSVNTANGYRIFAGCCFRVPYPFNGRHGSIIGNDYGNNDLREPATFESANMNKTSSGFTGFNNDEAEDLGPFDALVLKIKHEWNYTIDGSGGKVLAGNFAYRCVLYDIDDGVVKQDFVIPFNGLWHETILPVSGFDPYEARAPWAFGNAGQNLFLQEIEILKKFRWRNIKKIAIHWLGPYDDEGRYKPLFNMDIIAPSIIDFLLSLVTDAYNIKLSVDSFGWAHPGLSVSPPDTQRPLSPIFFEEPLIGNKFQNDQANLAKLEIMKFRHKQYEITTEGRNNLRYGDSYFLENSFLVKESDRTINDVTPWVIGTDYTINDDVKDGGIIYRCIQDHTSAIVNQPPNTTFWKPLPSPIPNTIKLVAKSIQRTIDKLPAGNVGGFLRTIIGVKRFDG
jgi:hypothetical protein